MLVLRILLLTFAGLVVLSSSERFNVLDYGAVDDDTIDSTQAFLNAWDAACCPVTDESTIIVPQGKSFMVYPAVFLGPCNAKSINFQILGDILAPDSPSAWEEHESSQWLVFKEVRGINVYGSGTINGRGSWWWNQSCRYHPHLIGCTKLAPTALKFISCSRTIISDVRFVDSPQTHITIIGSSEVLVIGVLINSPGNSPNTDGIHLQHAQNVLITNSSIGAGDDCVSIGDYTSNISIMNVTCGPGHGISIGSLGKAGNFVQVENIMVKDVYLKGTTNGARIKTWQVGRGYVRGVTFENLHFQSVMNPVIIDQNYCEVKGACEEEETGVWITDVSYKKLYGTSMSRNAILLNCSRSVPCTEIALDTILLRSPDMGKELTSSCTNAYGVNRGLVFPPSCLERSSSTMKY